MKRKLATLLVISVMTAMLSACGGSSSGSSAPASEPAAEETTAEAVVEEEVKEEAAGETPAPAATEAAAEEAVAAATASETAATAATAAAAVDAQEGEFSSSQMSQVLASEDFENITPLEESKQLPVTEVAEGEEVEDKGIAFSNGEMYEYTAFRSPASFDGEEYMIIYTDPVTNVLCGMLEVIHFNKSSGITEDYLRNFDMNTLFPGFYDIPFAVAQVYSHSDYYELVVGFVDLDKPENVKIAKDYGLLILPGYKSGQVVDATSIKNQFKTNGYTEVSDYDLSKAGITP